MNTLPKYQDPDFTMGDARAEFNKLGQEFTAASLADDQNRAFVAYERLALFLEKVYELPKGQKADVTSVEPELGCIMVSIWDEEVSEDPIVNFTVVHSL